MKVRLNGEDQTFSVDATRTLLEVLRDDFGLGGAREGCGIGVCGACTVLVDGRAISSCLMLAGQVEGKEILTIEGLAVDQGLHPIQKAYVEQAAFQCAYCTPGFILSTLALLDEHPNPTKRLIREYLAGNLCRCGSYRNILKAVEASRQRRLDWS